MHLTTEHWMAITIGVIIASIVYLVVFNHSKSKQTSHLVFSDYQLLLDMLSKLHIQLSIIREIDVLMDKQAEINPVFVDANNYTSSESLFILRDYYLRELKINNLFICDLYNVLKDCFSVNTSNYLLEEIKYIQNEILYENCNDKYKY